MLINFISSKDSDETRTMHTKSNNMEIMMGNETDEIIKELFEYLLQKYQEGLEESKGKEERKTKGSDFVFDSVHLLLYKLDKISLNRGGPYIDSPERLKNKKATINLKDKNNKWFQYALTVALKNQNIKNNPERTSKMKPFIDQYNWNEIGFASHQKDWKKFELNNKWIALNILYVPHNTEEIRHAYASKYNTKRENQVILLMITDGEKSHYLAVNILSALLRGITPNHKTFIV